MLVGLGVTGYAVVRHFNDNIQQANITALLGPEPADLHPQAENILFIGSHTGTNQQSGLQAYQAGTLILLHVAADRKWAEVVGFPPGSYVHIPSCTMSNGQPSAPTMATINDAFAIGSLHGDDPAHGAACAVKTVEADTGLYVNHFIEFDYRGFSNMIAALGGLNIDLPTAFSDPANGVYLPAGQDVLTPFEALDYMRALSGTNVSDASRLGRQLTVVSALIGQAKSELYNPVAMYRFLDAVTKSLTIDSQFGGITGLYHFWQTVRDIPAGQTSAFSLPTHTSGGLVLWNQPEDTLIFTALRNDVPVPPGLLSTTTVTAI
jgi:LCP family protein required for cell wall assembly